MRAWTHLDEVLDGLRESGATALQTDSRRVRPGDAFIAWPGAVTDGRRFVAQALAQGARACLVESQGAEAFDLDHPRVATCAQLKALCGPLADRFYGQPSQALAVLAVTGTNGKTSTAWWLADALNILSKQEQQMTARCGLIGTLGVGVPPQVVSTGLTTPDPVTLQQAFRAFTDQGFTACAMEASSIGLAEGRLLGTRIHTAVFTNFTQDHLDYHGSMAAYWQAKAALFRWPGLKTAVVNVDDPQGEALALSLQGSGVALWSTSCVRPARLRAQGIRYGTEGLEFEVCEGVEVHPLHTRLIGQYNVANLLGVIGALRSLGVPLAQAAAAAADLQPVPGRMQCLGSAGQPLVAVDYAHTPDALDKALQALRPLAGQRRGRLWCVFGCGGQRDAAKRPLMAAVAQRHADIVVVTSDNPRAEKPEHIISQILLGLPSQAAAQVNPDRGAAIADALAQAAPEDVVLIAGKGHETTQEVGALKLPFSDLEHAQAALDRRPPAPERAP